MDFLGKQCPVCNKYFHADDDIVVCPDCGAPHHRECWDAIGHCHYEDQHAEGFSYDEQEATDSDTVLCRSCGKPNSKTAFFCQYCAAPLSKEEERQSAEAPGPQPDGMNGMPFGGPAAMYMDPLGGVPADTDMGDGITAGEMAKYVKQNTPYFIRVFTNIKQLNRSRFNFCAALFSGGYLLYRKMYKIGALMMGLHFAMMILSTYISIRYRDDFVNLVNQSGGNSFTQIFNYLSTLSKGQQFVLFIPTFAWLATLILRLVIGATANRMYFKHCRQQITLIKSSPSGEAPENALQTRGGVNVPLAISLLVTYMLINYLPNFISRFF